MTQETRSDMTKNSHLLFILTLFCHHRLNEDVLYLVGIFYTSTMLLSYDGWVL